MTENNNIISNIFKKWYDITSFNFWEDWINAGGDCFEYFDKVLPNYSLIGTLLVGFSLNMCLSPPEMDLIIPFIFFMNLSTITSMIIIFLSVFIHDQFMCCHDITYNKKHNVIDARLNFCKRYGYLISVLTSLLSIDAISLIIAILIFYYDIFPVYTFILNMIEAFIAIIAIVYICYNMNTWNRIYNYGKVIRRKRRAKRKKRKRNKVRKIIIDNMN